MSYKFGKSSLEKLETCDVRLRRLMHEVIKHADFTVICGHRGEEEQNKAYREGKSKLQYPSSKHNKKPSVAIDIAPNPIDWKDERRFYYLGGLVTGIAKEMGIDIRWGGDWNGDGEIKDNRFNDLVHFELIYPFIPSA